MKTLKRSATWIAAALILLTTVGVAMAHLSVTITSVGTVVGQTKELTISAQTAVGLFALVATLPACATQAASTFPDVPTVSLNWGATLQSNTDYETFICIGNIGANAGTIRVTVTGGAAGETCAVEQVTAGLLGGLTATALDGATIASNGVVVARLHLHTPAVGLNAVAALSSRVSFTFS